MRKRVAAWLRRVADWLDAPAVVDEPAEAVIDRRLWKAAWTAVRGVEGVVRAGSIKHLTVAKQLEELFPIASRLDINIAIEGAVKAMRDELI